MFSRKFSRNWVKRIHILRDFSYIWPSCPQENWYQSTFSHSYIRLSISSHLCQHWILPFKKINKLKKECHSCLLQEVFIYALNLNKDGPWMFHNSVESRGRGLMRREAVLSSCRWGIGTGLGHVPDVRATEMSSSRD